MLKIINTKNTVFILLATIIFASCGIAVRQEPSGQETNGILPEQAYTADNFETAGSHYPVTIENFNFARETVDITFEKAPEKVLAVYQNSIETMLALGLEDRIIAAAGLDHSVKPEFSEAFDTVNYLTGRAPDRETVTMMQPDFILSWYSYFNERNLGDVNYWNGIGVNTFMSRNSGASVDRTLENEYLDILDLGIIFNVEDKAEQIVNEIKEEVNKVFGYASAAETQKSVLVIEFFSEHITVYGSASLGGDMVMQLGADLISVEGNRAGVEDIIALDPDVVFIVYMDSETEDGEIEDRSQTSIERMTLDPRFASLFAVTSGNVHSIQLGEMYCSGIRTIDGILKFAKGIYPELYQ